MSVSNKIIEILSYHKEHIYTDWRAIPRMFCPERVFTLIMQIAISDTGISLMQSLPKDQKQALHYQIFIAYTKYTQNSNHVIMLHCKNIFMHSMLLQLIGQSTCAAQESGACMRESGQRRSVSFQESWKHVLIIRSFFLLYLSPSACRKAKACPSGSHSAFITAALWERKHMASYLITQSPALCILKS